MSNPLCCTVVEFTILDASFILILIQFNFNSYLLCEQQSESARRHNERLQNIREKAFIMSIVKHSTEDQLEAPKLEPYNTKKICTVCNIMIPSEVHLQSHLRGQLHQSMISEKQTSGTCWSKDEIVSNDILFYFITLVAFQGKKSCMTKLTEMKNKQGCCVAINRGFQPE